MKEQPNYYGILPANVRYDKNLPANAKLLYSEITALAQKDGYCYASNGYFAELYDVSDRSISEWINKLSQNGYIEVQLVKNNSGTFRKLFLSGMKKSSTPRMKKTSTQKNTIIIIIQVYIIIKKNIKRFLFLKI